MAEGVLPAGSTVSQLAATWSVCNGERAGEPQPGGQLIKRASHPLPTFVESWHKAPANQRSIYLVNVPAVINATWGSRRTSSAATTPYILHTVQWRTMFLHTGRLGSHQPQLDLSPPIHTTLPLPTTPGPTHPSYPRPSHQHPKMHINRTSHSAAQTH
mgnify:CR=1 FL=1